MVEHATENRSVDGSIPSPGTISLRLSGTEVFFFGKEKQRTCVVLLCWDNREAAERRDADAQHAIDKMNATLASALASYDIATKAENARQRDTDIENMLST